MKEQILEVSLWYSSLFNSNLRDRKTIKSGMKRVFHFLFHVLFFTCLYTNEFLSTDGDHKSTKANLKILSYFYIITWTHAVIYYSLCAQLFFIFHSHKNSICEFSLEMLVTCMRLMIRFKMHDVCLWCIHLNVDIKTEQSQWQQ